MINDSQLDDSCCFPNLSCSEFKFWLSRTLFLKKEVERLQGGEVVLNVPDWKIKCTRIYGIWWNWSKWTIQNEQRHEIVIAELPIDFPCVSIKIIFTINLWTKAVSWLPSPETSAWSHAGRPNPKAPMCCWIGKPIMNVDSYNLIDVLAAWTTILHESYIDCCCPLFYSRVDLFYYTVVP